MGTLQAEVSWLTCVPGLFARWNTGRPRNLCLQGNVWGIRSLPSSSLVRRHKYSLQVTRNHQLSLSFSPETHAISATFLRSQKD